VLGCVAIEERGEASDGKGNVGSRGHSEVHKAANKLSVWGLQTPFYDFRWFGRRRVWAAELEAGDHRRVHRAGVTDVEAVYETVNVGGLGYGNRTRGRP